MEPTPSPSMLNRMFTELRRALIAGVLVLAPLGVTFWVFFALVGRADRVIELLPDRLQPEALLGMSIPGLGILLSLVLVTAVGSMMQYYTGRRVVELYEGLLSRVPVLSGIYQGVKQLIDTICGQWLRALRAHVGGPSRRPCTPSLALGSVDTGCAAAPPHSPRPGPSCPRKTPSDRASGLSSRSSS